MKTNILYPTIKEAVQGLCMYCEKNQGTVLNIEGENQFICEDCDCNFTYCYVCKFNYQTDWDTPCRHLTWSDDCGDWVGCGSCYDIQDMEIHKKSFLRLLDKIGVYPAKCLLLSVKRHKYYHQFSGTIFGWTSLNAYWLQPQLKSCFNFGDIIMQDMGEKEELLELGIKWLVSLWSDYYGHHDLAVSLKADNITAKWIKQWILYKNIIYLLFCSSSLPKSKIFYFKLLN